MKTIRILSLILALLMMAFTLVACNDDETPDDGTTPDDDANKVVNATEIEVVTKGTPNYVIVRDYKAGAQTNEAVSAMVTAFKDYLNCEIEVRECYSDRDDAQEAAPEAKEILVGSTNRPESAQALDGKKASDFGISIIGEKLIIAGGSDEATATAVIRFMTGFIYEQGDKPAVKQGKKLSLTVTAEAAGTEDFNRTGKYSYNKAVMCDARIDSYVLIYPRDSKMTNEYKAFADAVGGVVFKEVGYELKVYKDTRAQGDYEILIGDTLRTDAELADKLDEDEYYIALNKTEKGAVLTILFGKNAYDAALEAFNAIMPSSPTPIDFNLPDGFVKTNMQ